MQLGIYLVSLAAPALSLVAESSEPPAKLPTLAELYETHRQHVYSVAFKYCGGRADAAEDVTANVFMRANDFLPNLDPALDVRGWLYRVTKNAALSHMKSESRWRRRTLAFLQGRPAEAADPESTMSERQLADLAWQAISTFPALSRNCSNGSGRNSSSMTPRRRWNRRFPDPFVVCPTLCFREAVGARSPRITRSIGPFF